MAQPAKGEATTTELPQKTAAQEKSDEQDQKVREHLAQAVAQYYHYLPGKGPSPMLDLWAQAGLLPDMTVVDRNALAHQMRDAEINATHPVYTTRDQVFSTDKTRAIVDFAFEHNPQLKEREAERLALELSALLPAVFKAHPELLKEMQKDGLQNLNAEALAAVIKNILAKDSTGVTALEQQKIPGILPFLEAFGAIALLEQRRDRTVKLQKDLAALGMPSKVVPDVDTILRVVSVGEAGGFAPADSLRHIIFNRPLPSDFDRNSAREAVIIYANDISRIQGSDLVGKLYRLVEAEYNNRHK
jgi:DNA-binding protein Fis